MIDIIKLNKEINENLNSRFLADRIWDRVHVAIISTGFLISCFIPNKAHLAFIKLLQKEVAFERLLAWAEFNNQDYDMPEMHAGMFEEEE